jgi:CRP-like cAMP-binding protein
VDRRQAGQGEAEAPTRSVSEPGRAWPFGPISDTLRARARGALSMSTATSPLLRKLSRFMPLLPAEQASIAAFEARRHAVAAHADLVHERQVSNHAYILLDGWACAYKLVPDGGRQVIDFAIPGDFMGLRSVLLRTSDHSFAAVTDIVVAKVSAQQMLDGFRRQPRLAAAILWAASRDEAMVVEHLVGVGRRSALVRTAHLLVELGLRLELVGLGSVGGYACPLNQYLLADAVGLTAVHVNRVLRQLRERRLVTVRDGRVEFHDLPGLMRLAEWHAGYLDQGQPLLPS